MPRHVHYHPAMSYGGIPSPPDCNRCGIGDVAAYHAQLRVAQFHLGRRAHNCSYTAARSKGTADKMPAGGTGGPKKMSLTQPPQRLQSA